MKQGQPVVMEEKKKKQRNPKEHPDAVLLFGKETLRVYYSINNLPVSVAYNV